MLRVQATPVSPGRAVRAGVSTSSCLLLLPRAPGGRVAGEYSRAQMALLQTQARNRARPPTSDLCCASVEASSLRCVTTMSAPKSNDMRWPKNFSWPREAPSAQRLIEGRGEQRQRHRLHVR
jgi:hypothetical protein